MIKTKLKSYKEVFLKHKEKIKSERDFFDIIFSKIKKNEVFVLTSLKKKGEFFSYKEIYDHIEKMFQEKNLTILEKSFFSKIFFKYLNYDRGLFIKFQDIYSLFCDQKKIEVIKEGCYNEKNATKNLKYKIFLTKNLINEKRFVLKNNYKNKRENILKDMNKIIYNEKSNNFYILSKNKKIEILLQKKNELESNKIIFNEEKSIIENINIFEVDEIKKTFFCVSHKNVINFYDYNNKKDLILSQPITFSLLKLIYVKEQNKLITLNYGNELIIYTFKKEREKDEIVKLFSIKTMLLSITILDIKNSYFLAVGSYSGIIQIFDIEKKKFTKILNENKYFDVNENPTIEDMIFVQLEKGMIITFGNKNYLSVWSADFQLKKQFKGKLIGHKNKIVCVDNLNNHNEIVSMDQNLNIRIWNLCLMQCIQIFNIEENVYEEFKFTPFLLVKNKKEILVFGKKIHFIKNTEKLEYLENNKLFDLYFDINNTELFLVYEKQVKIFSILTGKLKSVFITFFNNLKNKITQFKRDSKKKLIFILDDDHNFKIIKEINFSILIEIYNPELTTFFVLKGINIILFTNIHNKLDLYTYSNNQITFLRSLINSEFNYKITSCFFFKKNNLFFTGDSMGFVNIWNLEKGIHEGVIKNNKKKIIEINIFVKTNIMYIMDEEFLINFWYIKHPNELPKRGKFMINNTLEFIAKINLFTFSPSITHSFLYKLNNKEFQNIFPTHISKFCDHFIILCIDNKMEVFYFDVTPFLNTFNQKIFKKTRLKRNAIFRDFIYDNQDIVVKSNINNKPLNEKITLDCKNKNQINNLNKILQLKLVVNKITTNLSNDNQKMNFNFNIHIRPEEVFLTKNILTLKENNVDRIQKVDNFLFFCIVEKNGNTFFFPLNKNCDLGYLNTSVYDQKQKIDLNINFWKIFIKKMKNFIKDGFEQDFKEGIKEEDQKDEMIINFIDKYLEFDNIVNLERSDRYLENCNFLENHIPYVFEKNSEKENEKDAKNKFHFPKMSLEQSENNKDSINRIFKEKTFSNNMINKTNLIIDSQNYGNLVNNYNPTFGQFNNYFKSKKDFNSSYYIHNHRKSNLERVLIPFSIDTEKSIKSTYEKNNLIFEKKERKKNGDLKKNMSGQIYFFNKLKNKKKKESKSISFLIKDIGLKKKKKSKDFKITNNPNINCYFSQKTLHKKILFNNKSAFLRLQNIEKKNNISTH